MNKLLSIIVAVCLAINLLYLPIYAETEEPFKIILETEDNDSNEFNYQTIEEMMDSGDNKKEDISESEDKNVEYKNKETKVEEVEEVVYTFKSGDEKSNVEYNNKETKDQKEEIVEVVDATFEKVYESEIKKKETPKETVTDEPDDTTEVTEESGSDEPKRIPMGEFKITYYCGCYSCSEGWGTMTSTGVRAVEGRTIAVDPTVIPYGAKVYINGHEYIAEDCGGAIKGNDIDIYLEDHDRVYKGGVDYYDVEIVLD